MSAPEIGCTGILGVDTGSAGITGMGALSVFFGKGCLDGFLGLDRDRCPLECRPFDLDLDLLSLLLGRDRLSLRREDDLLPREDERL
jgi:hypothetical protein